ncbi:MAG: hypothetical protein AAB267_06655 [Candidatus Desantisbacteria bacterium]
MKTEAYPLRIPNNLVLLAEAISRERYVDKSTALRQMMYEGAETYVLEAINNGRFSVSKGAEILNKSMYEIYRLAKRKNIEIGATLEQYEKGKESAKKIL